MSINEVLAWIFSSGGNAVIASWVLERIPWFQTLASNVKQWVYFGLVFALAVGAYLVLTYVPVETLNAIAPFFGILYTAFTGVFLGTGFHKIDKQSSIK